MTDYELEQRLRAWYRAEVADAVAPAPLRASLTMIPSRSGMPADGLLPRPQLRRFWSVGLFRRLAAAGMIAVLLVGGGIYLIGSEPEISHPSPTAITRPSSGTSASPDAAAVASPSPNSSTQSSSLEPCLTDNLEVLTGDALPVVDSDVLEGFGPARGVYLEGRPPMVWAVNPGHDAPALIASISPEPNILDILDVSADGSKTLIRVGNLSPQGFTPECADLYMVRTDGSAATRLTSFGTGRFVTGAAFSPDGRRVAYTWWAPETITTLDLENGAAIDQGCSSVYSAWPTRIAWSTSGERLAATCEQSLTIFDAGATTPPAKFSMAEEPLAFSWTDERQLMVASGGGTFYSFDVSNTSDLLANFDDRAIEIVSGTGVFSPDGRWLAYHGGERGDVPGNDFREAAYVVPTSGGTPVRVPGDGLPATIWSGDSRALISVTHQTEPESRLDLVRMDVETLRYSTVGTISNPQQFPFSYRGGIWHVP